MHQTSGVSRPRRGRRWLAVTVAAAACLAGAGAAQATVTTSNITAPADGSLFLYNATSTASQTVTVSGTSDGTTGDAVDIVCYSGVSVVGGPYKGTSGTGVPVNADGTFTTSLPLSKMSGVSCSLAAVPDGTTPARSGFTGPRTGVSRFETSTIGGTGPNADALYDFGFQDNTLTGVTSASSIGDCGPYQTLLDGTSVMNRGPSLLDCAGTLTGSPADFTPSGSFDLTRSALLVDGHNAYGSYSADGLPPGTSNAGFPALTASLDAFDPSTGNAQTTEAETLVECSPDNVYKPDATQCASFVSSGVRLQRVIDYTGGGRVGTVTDTYTSTDGASHAVDLQYETDLDRTTAGWQLPGETSFSQHSTGDPGPAAPSAPGTIYTIWDRTQAPSLGNPVSAMTFATAYNSITFDDTLWGGEDSALIDYQRAVPATGPLVIQWSYANGDSLAAVQASAALAGDAFSPPAISISSPASGATLTSTPVTVTGTAHAFTGVKSVTVNGVTASLGASGAFSAAVPLNLGTNTLTATLTSNSGTTKSASEAVTYTGAAPVATTGGASQVGTSTAKVSGSVVPGGSVGTYYFQYGKTNRYGHQTAAKPLAAGAGAVPVGAKLGRLASHSGYHYRLVATNRAGTSYGADKQFKTRYALRGMTLKVSRTGTHAYHVTGALKLPKGVSKARGCQGTVTVTAKRGRRKVGSRRVGVTKRCTYAAGLSAHVNGHGKLTVTATFNGNGLIGSLTARAVTALFG